MWLTFLYPLITIWLLAETQTSVVFAVDDADRPISNGGQTNTGPMLERRHTNNNPKLQWVRFHLTGLGVKVCKVNSKSLNFSGEKPFECKLCHQRSRDYSAMIKHLRTHNGASPYQCTICQDFCPSLAAMQKHMKGHKPEDVPADWRIEKTYLYVCYVWAGLGPHKCIVSVGWKTSQLQCLQIFHAERWHASLCV